MHGAHRKRVRWLWRALPLLGVLGLTLGAFAQGVGVTERPGLPAADWPTQFYYAIGLFVLGGLDLGVPVGGAASGRLMLWCAYFLAPLITTGAVLESILRALQPQWFQRMFLRRHIVLVGLGRLGTLYLEALKRVDPGRTVLAVDCRGDHVHVTEARARHGAHFVCGDITHRSTRDALCLERAAGVVLVTDNDLVNLEAAADITEEVPRLKGNIVVHVGELAMNRTITSRIGSAGNASGVFFKPAERAFEQALPDCEHHLFNAHVIAATHLVQTQLREHFTSTVPRDVVVLAGFGRFGQTILEALQTEAPDEFRTVVILDHNAQLRARQFSEQVGFRDGYRQLTIERDLSDPGAWDLVREELAGEYGDDARQVPPVFVLGSDDDGLNLRTALWLQKRDPEARIVVRAFYDSSFTRNISAQGGFDVFAVSSLLRQALTQRHRSWFTR